eukprot:2444860-Amphidinium_carterae.1
MTVDSHPPRGLQGPWQGWEFYWISSSGDSVTETTLLKKSLFQEASEQDISMLEQAHSAPAGSTDTPTMDGLHKELQKCLRDSSVQVSKMDSLLKVLKTESIRLL